MELSIIIPAYNEEAKIAKDILLADEFLKNNNLSGEIIVVDDGSADATYNVSAKQIGKIKSELFVIRNDKNYGKGYSVKAGVFSAKGKLIAYCDSGATIPFDNFLVGIKLIKNNDCEITNGSRMLLSSKIRIHQKVDRKITSSIVRKMAQLILGIPNSLTDTQCGFKIYKSEVAKNIFGKLETNGFMFESEVILRAVANNYRIKEFPVEWSCDRDSRITILKTTASVLKDLVRIKFMKFD